MCYSFSGFSGVGVLIRGEAPALTGIKYVPTKTGAGSVLVNQKPRSQTILWSWFPASWVPFQWIPWACLVFGRRQIFQPETGLLPACYMNTQESVGKPQPPSDITEGSPCILQNFLLETTVASGVRVG